MPDNLNATLALAKQYFEELVQLAPLESLRSRQYESTPARDRIDFLLKQLNSAIRNVDEVMRASVSHRREAPIITIAPGHLAFYKERLAPNAGLIRRAFLESGGFAGLAELLENLDLEPRGTPLASALSWGVERWVSMLGDDEKEDWIGRGFDVEGALEMTNEPWFVPDTWRTNAEVLQPIVTDRAASHIPTHVRNRLAEIYGAYIFGLWMAAIALSRSVAEYAIRDNAHRLGIVTTKAKPRGVVADKLLGELIVDVGRVKPALLPALEAIRDTGNRILHPKKRDVIAHPKVRREEALDCVMNTKKALELLYTDTEWQSSS